MWWRTLCASRRARPIHNVRQHSENACETSPNPCLTSSNVEILPIYDSEKSLQQFNLPHMDFLEHPAGIHRSTMICSRATQDASPNELTNPEKSLINRPKFIYSFALVLPAFNPDTVISSCACIILLLNKFFEPCLNFHNVRQHSENASETSTNPCPTSSNVEIIPIYDSEKSLQ